MAEDIGGHNRKKKLEETGCEVVCGASTTPTVKGSVKVKVKHVWPIL